ncbi:MAG: DUF2786 domain-containing protein [Alphaproteobacteria bacterium]|nr:DUF2786 domain-containing protein [Alphaproteobacteria bacterium]
MQHDLGLKDREQGPEQPEDPILRGVLAVWEAAAEAVAPMRVDQQLKRLLPGREASATMPDIELAFAAALAVELVVHMPSVNGRTALDRLEKMRGQSLDAEAVHALALMKRSRYSVGRVEARSDAEGIAILDALTGETLRGTGSVLEAAAGGRFAGRLATLEDGRVVAAGTILLLPEFGPEIPPGSLKADGRTLRNPHRTAEALCRAAIAEAFEIGVPLAAFIAGTGLRLRIEDDPDDDVGPGTDGGDAGCEKLTVPDDAPAIYHSLLAMAERWAAAGPVPVEEADHPDIRQLRHAATVGVVVFLIDGAARLKPGGPRAPALERMAAVQLDALHRRQVLGLSGGVDVLGTIGDTLAQASSSRAMDIFRRLSRSLGSSDEGREAGGPDVDLVAVLERIRALQAKTVEQGCTEAEAMAAAEKVSELLQRYELSLDAVSLRNQRCRGRSFATGRKQSSPLDDCLPAIAAFCDCRAWVQERPDGLKDHVFFGLPADLAAAECLYALVSETFETELWRFKGSATYRGLPRTRKAGATRSFQLGLGYGIADKLDALRAARAEHVQSTAGRSLVPVKTAAIEADLDALGMTFEEKQAGSRRIHKDSFWAGRVAGEQFSPEPAVREAAE